MGHGVLQTNTASSQHRRAAGRRYNTHVVPRWCSSSLDATEERRRRPCPGHILEAGRLYCGIAVVGGLEDDRPAVSPTRPPDLVEKTGWTNVGREEEVDDHAPIRLVPDRRPLPYPTLQGEGTRSIRCTGWMGSGGGSKRERGSMGGVL